MIKLQFTINCCDRGSDSILGEHLPPWTMAFVAAKLFGPGVFWLL